MGSRTLSVLIGVLQFLNAANGVEVSVLVYGQ